MIKNCLFTVALASLALAGGCAKGGNGVVPPPPSVDVSITSPANANGSALYPTQTVMLTATVSHSTTTAVTWSLSGPSGTNCTGNPNPCGTLTPVTPAPTPATATYVAPATPISGMTVTATLASDTSITGPLGLSVVDITTDVSPAAVSVGKGLTQQFTAVAVPDDAPQTFTWTCTAGGSANPCKTFSSDGSGVATYTANDSCLGGCVQISAVQTPQDPAGCQANPKYCTIAKASLVNSRVSGTYAFQFSGFDNNGSPAWVAGTFTTGTITNGVIAIVSGSEDVLTASGPPAQPISIAGGSYAPNLSDPNNSNNAGTLALTSSGVYPDQQYQVVLDGAGDIQMIESDGNGIGSGIAEPFSKSKFNLGIIQTFAFGFTGVDFVGNRVGYAGLLSTDGVANVTGGLMDTNDNGVSRSICSTPPCNVLGGYTYDPTSNRGQMTLTSPTAMKFDFFVASGATGTSNNNPLTLYAISTDPVTTNPAVLGTMIFQDSKVYDKTLFKGSSVSTLTGVNTTCAAPPCTNVSLTLGSTDGNGKFSGQFDQNNAGTIVSVPSSPSAPSFSYAYAASGTNNGRYTFQMLGNPDANPVVPPLAFVLYASGANRGFILEQPDLSPPDTSVMTGTMNPQGKGSGGFGGSELPSTFAAATTSSGSSAVSPIAANLLLTSPGGGVYNVSGTQYPPFVPPLQTLTGTYTMDFGGRGTIPLTVPAAQNYVFYVLDTSGCVNPSPVCAIQDFLMMDVDATATNPSIIFAQQ